MHIRTGIRLALALAVLGPVSTALAASEEDFKAAYAKAEALDKQSTAMKTHWTTTSNALKAAKKAADAGKFDEAIKHAHEAEALANASIHQAQDEEKNWTKAVIR